MSRATFRSPAIIYAFNVSVEKKLAEEAAAREVDIRPHNVIYRLLEDVKDLMSAKLPPKFKTEVVSELNVQAVFEVSAKKNVKEKVAGCKVDTGKLTRKSTVRVMRKGQEIWQGTLRSMKHFKKEVDELVKGQECGLVLDGFDGFEEGDVIQGVLITEVTRRIA